MRQSLERKMNFNLSDQEFFNLYVKDNDWFPLQNHGLIDKEIELKKEDLDFPNQVTTYLNLFKDIKIDNQSILDIGCGWGRGTHIIKKYFEKCNVTGIDVDPSYIDYAKLHFKECNYLQDNFFNTKIKKNSFDFIVSNCSMHFFYNYNVPFNNFKNILKSEGKVLITDIWTNESLFMFLTKCKQHEMKVLSIEDLTNQTIQAMEEDISLTFNKFKKSIPKKSISAFIDIQSERLTFFKQNINRQYKVIIKKEK
jgi:ubiquinone/menaquinone biosynthesis C-methylase UbiE